MPQPQNQPFMSRQLVVQAHRALREETLTTGQGPDLSVPVGSWVIRYPSGEQEIVSPEMFILRFNPLETS